MKLDGYEHNAYGLYWEHLAEMEISERKLDRQENILKHHTKNCM